MTSLSLRGPNDPQFIHIWSNPLLREWCILNVLEDEIETSHRIKLLLRGINPKFANDLEKALAQEDEVIISTTAGKKDEDPRVIESFKRYEEHMKKFKNVGRKDATDSKNSKS
jgi:hypothetical protein